MSLDIYRALVEAAGRGEAAALVTVVATSGSTPQRVGAKMIVFRTAGPSARSAAAATRTTPC